MLVMEDDEMDRVKLSESIRNEIIRCLSNYTKTSLEFGERAFSALEDALHPITPGQTGENG